MAASGASTTSTPRHSATMLRTASSSLSQCAISAGIKESTCGSKTDGSDVGLAYVTMSSFSE
eukprot:8911385-Lingulodinium_polyedra.AAC.1